MSLPPPPLQAGDAFLNSLDVTWLVKENLKCIGRIIKLTHNIFFFCTGIAAGTLNFRRYIVSSIHY